MALLHASEVESSSPQDSLMRVRNSATSSSVSGFGTGGHEAVAGSRAAGVMSFILQPGAELV